MAREPVPAPPAVPPRYGFLAAVPTIDSLDRWQRGVIWQSEQCGASGVLAPHCSPASDTARTAPARPGFGRGNEFYVWAADECSTLGATQRDWQGRARRQLEATQSFQIAREFWTGALTREEFLDSAAVDEDDRLLRAPFLEDDDNIVLEDTIAPHPAVAMAEQAAMEAAQGRRIALHLPIMVLAEIMSQNGTYITRDPGGLLMTPLGSIVVADAGYPGTGPVSLDANDNFWLYATTIPQVRLSDVELVPGDISDARFMSQAMQRDRNNAAVWAQRLALYQLDTCARVAVQTNLARPTDPAFPQITTS